MAHRIVYNGQDYPLSVAVLTPCGEHGWSVSIIPFSEEIHSTTFVNGTVSIVISADGPMMERISN